MTDQLARLAELREQGVLSEAEFEAQQAQQEAARQPADDDDDE